MDVLLANVALWSGRTRECVERGNEAIELFQEIGDRWGEMMSTSSVVRAQAELGQRRRVRRLRSRATKRSRRALPDEGMRTIPIWVEASVQLQRGNATARDTRSWSRSTPADADEPRRGRRARRDRPAAPATRRHRPARSSDWKFRTRPPPTTVRNSAVGCRLALAYAAAHRCEDARDVLAEHERSQRRYVLRPDDRAMGRSPRARADRKWRRPGQRRRRARHRDRDRRPARARDRGAGPGVRAGSARRRPTPPTSATTPNASSRHSEITGDGWRRVFELALEGVQPRSPRLARRTPMTEISERYERLGDAFAAKIAAVPADRWSAPSPCRDWTAHDVVSHVVATPGHVPRLRRAGPSATFRRPTTTARRVERGPGRRATRPRGSRRGGRRVRGHMGKMTLRPARSTAS